MPPQRCFAPELDAWGNTSVDGVLIAGDCGGIGGARAAENAGRLAALEVLRRLGRIDAARRDGLAIDDRRDWQAHIAARQFLDALYAPRSEILRPADDVIVCRCEEIDGGRGARGGAARMPRPEPGEGVPPRRHGPCQGRLAVPW